MNPRKLSRKRSVMLTPQGWQKLQDVLHQWETQQKSGDRYTLEELSELTGLDPDTVAKVLAREKGVDRRTLERFFKAFNLELEASDYAKLASASRTLEGATSNGQRNAYVNALGCHDLTEAVDVSLFYGRTEELAKLEQWIVGDCCRLIALLGIGGIGKTALSVRSAEQLQHQFEYVIWKSLRNAPPIKEFLANLLQFLSNLQETDLSDNVDEQISRLLEYLRSSRCLLVLDNVDAVLKSGERVGYYRKGYEAYGELLRRIGETRHQSCLVVTSREKPKEIALLEGEVLPVRSLNLGGLSVVDGQAILRTKRLRASEDESRALVERYSGNPLALKIVATTIKDVLDGRISEFLSQKAAVFGDIRDLLEQQFNRLSNLEKESMHWLAINREPVSLSELQEDIVSPVQQLRLLEVLESLRRRSLIERSDANFSLQPVVMEYVTECIIEQVCQEITTQKITLLRSHALLKAGAKDYVRDTQVRLILKPLTDELLTNFRNFRDVKEQLTQILSGLQGKSPLEPGYTGGNILNLLCQLKTDLSGHDFSHLTIWQADLRRVHLHHVNFTSADLTSSAFTETFGGILSVALSPDEKFLVTGDTNGEICLWQVADGKKLFTYKKHIGWVWSVAFSCDGCTLASGGTDHVVKLWDVSTGRCLGTLQGHTDRLRSVAFSPDGRLLASGSDDQTVKLWDVSTGKCLDLQGHTDRLRSVAFSPDGRLLASGSDDQTVKLWDVSTGQVLKTLHGHTSGVWSVAFSSDGYTLASGGNDRIVQLWNIASGQLYRILQGHTHGVRSVVFSPDGYTLVSGSMDQTVRLWDISTGQCLRALQGHTSWVCSVALGQSGCILASGSDDRIVRLWDVPTGRCLRIMQGHSNSVWSVAFSPNGHLLVSVSDDRTVRLWDIREGKCQKTLHGHSGGIWSVAFSSDGYTVASGSDDQTIKLWDIREGKCRKTLHGHSGGVWSVAFSPDGRTLASGGVDRTIKLWDIREGKCRKILQGHMSRVRSVAFSPDGLTLASDGIDRTIKLWDVGTGQCQKTLHGHTHPVSSLAFGPDSRTLVSGSDDQTVRLWDASSGQCLKTLQGHADWVQFVAFSPDGCTLASGSHDQTVKLWDVSTGLCKRSLQGHTGLVWSVGFSPDSQTLSSSSQDETIRLWDTKTGECLKALRVERPYEGMNITGVIGITEAQKATLKALGAAEL